MNKILEKARQSLEKSKAEAENKRDALLLQLDKDFEWKNLNKDIRRLQVEIGLYKKNDNEQRLKLNKLLELRKHYLKKKGLDESIFNADYSCKKCNDTGTVNGHRCQCLSRELRKILFSDSKNNGENCTFENSKETDNHNNLVYKKCREFCEKFGSTKIRNILICGKTGTGKTYLLQSMVNQLLNFDCEVCFFTAYALNQQFLNCYLSDLESKKLYIDNIIDADVLVIDDLGTEQILRNVTLEYLFAVLNERKQLGKSTIVSSNLDLTGLRNRYEDRVFSRILDSKDSVVFELVGKDKRVNSY